MDKIPNKQPKKPSIIYQYVNSVRNHSWRGESKTTMPLDWHGLVWTKFWKGIGLNKFWLYDLKGQHYQTDRQFHSEHSLTTQAKWPSQHCCFITAAAGHENVLAFWLPAQPSSQCIITFCSSKHENQGSLLALWSTTIVQQYVQANQCFNNVQHWWLQHK